GVARNDGVRAFLAKELGREVTVAPEPELAGALGAALLARDRAANR
ncbi:MAG: 2-hydroxyglutaryl-CoA dehydratase, partial [Peptococcaceae bacterium]|nr:2-hydroxyglutaryl-CoA dehydratase [Peptococcaceae bacterium]